MAKRATKWYSPLIVLAIMLICFGWVAFFKIMNSFLDNVFGVNVLGQGYYQIEPENILTAIDSGNNNVFVPLSIPPVTPALATDNPVQWKQFEYLQIAEAFHEFVWDEPLERWNIDKIYFRLQCEDVENGPQFAEFDLFKKVKENGHRVRTSRTLTISPCQGVSSWEAVESKFDMMPLQSIDLDKLTVPVEDAIRIAEENGGDEARSEVNDNCTIDLTLLSSKSQTNWYVMYVNESVFPLLQMQINSITGEFIKTE